MSRYRKSWTQVVQEVQENIDIDEKFAGWIAFYNKEKLEIKPKKGEIDSLYDAKQAAIKHFKVPKSKQGLLAIEPAHEEVALKEAEMLNEFDTVFALRYTGKNGKRYVEPFKTRAKAEKRASDIVGFEGGRKWEIEKIILKGIVKWKEGVEKEARTYLDREDERKKKKSGKVPQSQKKSRWGAGGYGKGEEVEESQIGTGDQESRALIATKARWEIKKALKSGKKQSQDWWNKQVKLADIDDKDKPAAVLAKLSKEEIEEDYDKNQLLRVQHDERLIAEAGDICGLDRGDLRSKAMQKVYDKKCSPEMIKKKKSIFGKIAKGLDLYNSIGEEKMKDLISTSRKVLMGEAEGDKEAYQKFFDKALKKFKIKSPADLKDDEAKKKFYDYIDKNWKADHEEEKEVETKKKVTESAALQLKMAFDDEGIKIKGAKSGKLVIDKKDKKKVEKIISKQMKDKAAAKRVLGSQIVFEDSEKSVSKLFAHVRKLMTK